MQAEQTKEEIQKYIEVYYKDNKVSIGYYQNTSKEEVCETLRGIFGIDPEISSQQMQFQDENGIVVFSPKNVPNRKKLFLIICGGIKKNTEKIEQLKKADENEHKKIDGQKKVTEQHDKSKKDIKKLFFYKKEGEKHPELSEDKKKAYNFNMGNNIFSYIAFVDLKFQKGYKYYFEITYEVLTCCMTSAIQNEGESIGGGQGNISQIFNCSMTSSKVHNKKLGVIVDLKNKNTIKFINLATKQNICYQIPNSWDISKMKLGFCTKHSDNIFTISDLLPADQKFL
ncbi:hypothetical protein PPERSA_03606 [Pseudocohnilembus persalinus]|uniref:Uncharacterized protein n=1 Tax=Pseudocohnilembus persalinus TaxID=266149 RepID=A0A0V0QDW2_PSEPJ|nr:hypothetical protein PPERSA_03606 [Pseudocohnilembus persalinus]|eukprot:KRX00385.1 hypothetical protein PPERSA_03606 [Pseudocohnilembus persalinus]